MKVESISEPVFEHSARLLTCIKRYSVFKNKFGLLFEWLLKTGFTVFFNVVLVVISNLAINFMLKKKLFALLIVFSLLCECLCSISLPRDGWPEVYDCGISCSYSLVFVLNYICDSLVLHGSVSHLYNVCLSF